MDLFEECVKSVLGENRNSKNINIARKALMSQGKSYEECEQLFKGINHDIPMNYQLQSKFMLGLCRLFLSGELKDATDINKINEYLKIIGSAGHIDEYNNDLNGLSFDEIEQRFAPIAQQNAEQSRAEVSQMNFGSKSDYNIVKIETEEQCKKYGKYTSWCITHGSFSSYGLDNFNQCYFCLKPGFENVQKPESHSSNGEPFDEYGLSMISIIVNQDGEPMYVTTRYNHDFNGENNEKLRTAKQVSELLGLNFYDVFKPNSKWQDLINSCSERVKNGEEISNVFDNVHGFSNGFAAVYLRNKFNFIDENCNYLSKQWFDYVYNFDDGFARAELENKWNFLNTEGNYLSKQWFDSIYDFNNGFAIVKLENKRNFINKEGNYLSNEWFDYVDDFYDGFARVQLENKWNFINKEGNYLSKQWFDNADDFYDGLAAIKLGNKRNYINIEGKIISEQWFDYTENFDDGFANVKLNGKWIKIDTDGNLHANENINNELISFVIEKFKNINE